MRTVICRTVLLNIFIVGLAAAGEVFAAGTEAGAKTAAARRPRARQAAEKPKAAATGHPRELAMRPLPAYRIEPPDLLQIELLRPKPAPAGGSQPSPGKARQQTPPAKGAKPGKGTMGSSGGAGVDQIMVAGPVQVDVAGTVNAGAMGAGVASPGDLKVDAGNFDVTVAGPPVTVFSGVVSGKGSLSRPRGGGLTKTGTGTLTVDSNNQSTIQVDVANQTNSMTFSGAMTPGAAGGGGTLTKIGPGKLILTGTSNYSGSMTIDSDGMVLGSGTFAAAAGGKGRVRGGVVRPPQNVHLEISGMKGGGAESVTGMYLVGPDGTINLRQYGTVEVMGKTIAEAKAAVERQLSKFLKSPEVTVDVAGYNSKAYYIVTQGAGLGDNVVRVPITGNDTVLDAISQIGGLSQLSSKKMWIVRPSAADPDKGTILPVDFEAIVQRGATKTNYQLMPRDRLFIAADTLISLNNSIGKMTAPVERLLGMIGLATSVADNLQKLLCGKEPADPEQ